MATQTKSRNKYGTDTGFDLEAVPEQYRAQMEAMIPPEWVAERYINRTVDGVLDFDIVDMARETRHNLILEGPTGAGKTSLWRAYASHKRIPYCRLEMNGGYDHASAVGRTAVGEDGLPTYIFGEYALVVQYGGVGNVAECNFAPPRFTAANHGVLDAEQSLYVQEIGLRIPKHPACVITSDYNDGYAGTVKLNEAFLNRFALPMEWSYDETVEETLIGTYSPRLLTMVRNIRQNDKVRTDVGTNVMEEFLLFAQHERGNFELACRFFLSRFRASQEREIVSKALEANKAVIKREVLGAGEFVAGPGFADDDDVVTS